MNILLVDDERPALQELEDAVSAVLPTAQRFSFTSPSEALAFAETTPIDIAFWKVNMHSMSLYLYDICSAQALTSLCPSCNIIFCIANDEYLKDVPRIKRSPHLLKPVTPERVQSVLSRLRHPMLD